MEQLKPKLDDDVLNRKLTKEQIEYYQNIDSAFADYTKFEDRERPEDRLKMREAFLADEIRLPSYNYHQLDDLYFNQQVIDKKRDIYESVMELEAAKNNPANNQAELELYASFHELRLKKIMLVEAARNLQSHSLNQSDYEANKRAFERINQEVYGEYDFVEFANLIGVEAKAVDDFEPKTDLASKIKAELDGFLRNVERKDERSELLDAEEMKLAQDCVLQRYKSVLEVVPDTGDDVKYQAADCQAIMTQALEAGGLAEHGWRVEVNPAKSNVSTSTVKKLITLPVTTERDANQLRRLIIHEQEVHARRGHNGRMAGSDILRSGTANYADVEEGLAVMLECIVAGDFDNLSFKRAKNRYLTAGLALSGDGLKRDARDVFEVMWRLVAVQDSKNGEITPDDVDSARDRAYDFIENAYRGTGFYMQEVIYSKLKIYYEGILKNAKFFKDNIYNLDEALDSAMIGKYNHTDEQESQAVHDLILANHKGQLDTEG
ncbi:MAG: tyrosine/phenylalanine carboxypeptidase domain-containing protein [Candidatus Nanosyncoccaceae bacterium]|jgi:hypothetical protein